MCHSHVVRGRILVVIALNSIGASEHVGAVWELVEHGVHVGLAHWYSRVVRLALSHLGSIAKAHVLEGSSEIINSDIGVIRIHVCDRTWSKCLSGERGMHVPVHILAWSQCLTGESGGHIAVVSACKTTASKPGILFGTV